MSTTRDAVSWACTLEIPWSAEDIAAMTGLSASGVRSFLKQLAQRNVVHLLEDGRYIAGDRRALAQWRSEKPKTRDGGRSAAYRAAKAVRERLMAAEIEARRAGRLTSQSGAEFAQVRNMTQPSNPGVHMGPSVGLDKAARATGFSADTLRRWIDSGKIIGFRSITNHRRIPESELARILGYDQTKENAEILKDTLRKCTAGETAQGSEGSIPTDPQHRTSA